MSSKFRRALNDWIFLCEYDIRPKDFHPESLANNPSKTCNVGCWIKMSSPKNPDPSKMAILETPQTPLLYRFVHLPLEGPWGFLGRFIWDLSKTAKNPLYFQLAPPWLSNRDPQIGSVCGPLKSQPPGLQLLLLKR